MRWYALHMLNETKAQGEKHPFDPFWIPSLLNQDLKLRPPIKRIFTMLISSQQQGTELRVFQDLTAE